MKFNKDIIHITLYSFFFLIGGVIGNYSNFLAIAGISIWIIVIGVIVRKYFISEIEKEPIEYHKIIKNL